MSLNFFGIVSGGAYTGAVTSTLERASLASSYGLLITSIIVRSIYNFISRSATYSFASKSDQYNYIGRNRNYNYIGEDEQYNYVGKDVSYNFTSNE